MKRIAVMFLALVFVSTAAFADAADVGKRLSVRTFQFKHKKAENAAAIIKPLLSQGGTISIQANALVISDDAENLKKIAAALETFDAPPQPFHLTVRLVSAGRGPTGRVAAEVRDVESKLALLRFNVIDSIGSSEVDGREGEPGLVNLSNYRAEFSFGEYDPASDSIKVENFRLSRMDGDQLAPVMKTTLNLKLGQTLIMAVTRDAQSQRALMMVLSAKR